MNPLSPGSKAHYVHIWLSSPDSLQERCTWVQINLQPGNSGFDGIVSTYRVRSHCFIQMSRQKTDDLPPSLLHPRVPAALMVCGRIRLPNSLQPLGKCGHSIPS